MEAKIREYIESLDSDERKDLWNEYCNASSRTDDWIYSMAEFDDINFGKTPTDIAQCIAFGDFRITDQYFWFDGYANFASCDWIDDDSESPFYTEELVDFIIEEDDDLNDESIREILDEDE